jgi:hypothetical protein
MNAATAEFIRIIRHPLKFRMFLLSRLPAAYFSGVRVVDIDEKHCVTSVPFKWLTQNPFRSTYFASLAMAAEMSTGTLALAHLHKRKPAVSMLVVKLEAAYFKKATGKTLFTCSDGDAIRAAIERAVTTNEPQTIGAKSTGRNKDGEPVAEFIITWSFKARSK